MTGALVLLPLHSVVAPAVGMAYLRGHLAAHGKRVPLLDLNIELRDELRRADFSEAWLQEVFPFGERTYAGELLMSAALLDETGLAGPRARLASVTHPRVVEHIVLQGLQRWTEDAEVARSLPVVRAFMEERCRALAAQQLDWAGVFLVVTNQPAVIFFVRRLKELSPTTKIVVGGPHLHRENARAWAHALPEVEAVVVGDARDVLCRLLDGDPCSGEVVRACDPIMAPVQNLQGAPSFVPADWSGLDMGRYDDFLRGVVEGARGPTLPVLGARGCTFNRCTFCYEVLLTPRRQVRDVDDVVDEVERQRHEHGTATFFFTDVDFNGDYQRTIDLARTLERRVPGIAFHCWIRAHELDDAMLEALIAAGCRRWFVGLEGVVDSVLQRIRKGYDGAHARAVAVLMHRVASRHEAKDVQYGFNLIADYPGEQVEDVLETLKHLAADPDTYYHRVSGIYPFALTMNSPVWNQRHNLGLRTIMGWNDVLLPEPWRNQLPSHRYWYEEGGGQEREVRLLLWDEIRRLVGQPRVFTNVIGTRTEGCW